MNYLVFSGHSIGRYHAERNWPCEDASKYYIDQDGRFAMAAVCDGHGSSNCFRAETGARFGCESVLEALQSFFEEYCVLGDVEKTAFLQDHEAKLQELRQKTINLWNEKVDNDIRSADPMKDLGLERCDPRTQRFYRSGQGLRHIYGATMIAVGVCEDFYLTLHIGDGERIEVREDDSYISIQPRDDRPEKFGPSSLADDDLFEHSGGFRISFEQGRPKALFATSDGIGDMPTMALKDEMRKISHVLVEMVSPNALGILQLTDEQQKYVRSYLEFYANRSVSSDDCSFAAILRYDCKYDRLRFEQDEIDDYNAEKERQCDRYQQNIIHLTSELEKKEREWEKERKQFTDSIEQNRETEAKVRKEFDDWLRPFLGPIDESPASDDLTSEETEIPNEACQAHSH